MAYSDDGKPTDPREWQQQGPDPYGRGDGRHLFPDGKRYKYPSQYQADPDLERRLVHVHAIVYKQSYRYAYRYSVPPSREVLELELEHHSRQMADKHFPSEAWLRHPEPLRRSNSKQPRQSFQLDFRDVKILSVDETPIGKKPYWRTTEEPLKRDRRIPLNQLDRIQVSNSQFRKRYKELQPFIEHNAKLISKGDPYLRDELEQAALIRIASVHSEDLKVLQNQALTAMESSRKAAYRRTSKNIDLPKSL